MAFREIRTDMSKPPIEMIFDGLTWTAIPGAAGVGDDDGIPYATHQGVISLAGFELTVFQLNNGQRVFSADDLQKLFGGE